MDRFVVTSESLTDMVKQIAEKLLGERLHHQHRSYVKLDFNILDQDEYFAIQVTKCGNGCPRLKLLLVKTIKSHINCQNLISKDNYVLATVERKSEITVKVWNIVYNKRGSISSEVDQRPKVQKDLSAQKYYVSIKLYAQVHKAYLNEFSSWVLDFIKQIEQIDCYTKFIFRKGKEHLYRNYVQMDDSILSCKILNSACTNIFKNSQHDNFKKELLDLLNIKKSSAFEERVGCLLLAQVNSNFTEPGIKFKK